MGVRGGAALELSEARVLGSVAERVNLAGGLMSLMRRGLFWRTCEIHLGLVIIVSGAGATVGTLRAG